VALMAGAPCSFAMTLTNVLVMMVKMLAFVMCAIDLTTLKTLLSIGWNSLSNQCMAFVHWRDDRRGTKGFVTDDWARPG
jgi:hypothetical protein